jgi:conjugal transfer pilus assembly protein TraF
VPRTGVFDLIGRVLVTAAALTATLAVAPGLAADLPSGTRFLSRGAQGWFWYERMAPEPAPPAEPVVGAAPTPPAAATLEPAMETTATAPGPIPLSAAWFRAELERYRDLAIDDPTPDKVRAYLYLQKVMLDKAGSFARVSGEVAASDPYLDATTERPLAPFASSAANAEATSRRSAVLEELSATTGILFVVERACPVCLRQADVLEALRRQYGFAILTVSLDGAAPPGLMLPVRSDAGQAARLGVVGTPALYLMRPPDVILPLAQGALDQDTLLTRIVAQAHQAGWVDDATYAATRPVRQPFSVPDPGSLAAEALADPVQLVATLRTTLGLSDAILAGAQP